MRHSQKVHDAMQKVFDKLLAMSPKELADSLEKREVGPIGSLMRETDSMEALCEQRNYGGYTLVASNGFTDKESVGEYVEDSSEDEWLKAA